MADFMIHFFICNLFICMMIGVLLLIKQIFRNILSNRMQYHLWFLLLGLLTAPFLPFCPVKLPHIFSGFNNLSFFSFSNTRIPIEKSVRANLSGTANWIQDFTLSVNHKTSSVIGYTLFCIWVVGIFAMLLFIIKSFYRLQIIKKSALPLQKQEIHRLYQYCLNESNIRKNIPICSTAFLQSPVITGLLKPCIYLPIHLISDYATTDNIHSPKTDRLRPIRYMLLHELQHYKHKDILVNYLMDLAGIVYWFNPFVWYALKEMQNDREVACDSSVLEMLDENAYRDYGEALINFAEKVSLTPFPFSTNLGANKIQLKRRIINIATYQKPNFQKTIKSTSVFLLIFSLFLRLTPLLSSYAADENHYQWTSSLKNISHVDFTEYFDTYKGSFVLYDSEKDLWYIHDMDRATLRVSPNSTYKIYDALFGLEEDVITPNHSFLAWDGETYPFESWNTDQTLQTAMNASVNWYFQSMDKQLGKTALYNYMCEIEYGNKNISGSLPTYWMESSLKISPVEQVHLLKNLYDNNFDFAPENIAAVKDAIHISSSDTGTLYGKTGTGRVDGDDVNGWFIGFAEIADHTYFFATNIEANEGATGSKAAEITWSILSDMNIMHFDAPQ
ncbi:MAG: BlaR1 family beta-lactam sensor/signal transducer [Hespellia sp.]|nr:BlaR1 family beta-lactam sensor/signal transducer [Hespellia sp.]